MAKIIEIRVFGDEVVAARLTRMADAATNTIPLMNRIADYLMEGAAAKFSSSGRARGGSWKRLTPKWLDFKIRHGLDPRILHMRRDTPLRDSVTVRGAPGQVLNITRTRLEFGSKIPYAAVHQFGYPPKNIPARPFLVVTDRDRDNIRNMVADYIMKDWSGPVGRI